MSKDYMVFDFTGLNEFSDKSQLQALIDEQIGDGKASNSISGTEKICEIIDWASQKYGSTVAESAQWNTWPPIVLANGRYCTFNLPLDADSMTFMMILSDQCKEHGLVMIDPSGNERFITIPGGGGLLD